MKEFEIKVFGGDKTPEEKRAILIMDTLRLKKYSDRLTVQIVKSTFKTIIRKRGVKQSKVFLRENRELFESLLSKDELNQIYTECLKQD